MKRMPQLYEGIILRETDRTDTMSHLQRLANAYVGNGRIEEVDKKIEPLIKTVIDRDSIPNIDGFKTIEQLKKAQEELFKARKNITTQQKQFGKGIKSFVVVAEVAKKYNKTPESWLTELAKESIQGSINVLKTNVDKDRFEKTFQQQSNKILSVIMGYSTGESWADNAIKEIKTLDTAFVEDKKAGTDVSEVLKVVESFIRVFTALTGELFSRVKRAQSAVESRGEKI